MTDLAHAKTCRRFACHHGWGNPSPEVQDMQAWPVGARARDGVFHCTARPEKLCPGITRALGLTEADLREAGWAACAACGATVEPGGRCHVCHPSPTPVLTR